MLVDDDSEAGPLGMAHDVVELGEPRGIKPIVGVHVPERLQIQPDEVEAGVADLGEVPPLETALDPHRSR